MFDPNLKPYPDYKDSGVEWLGDVPTHWEVRRLKYLLQERDTRSADGHEQLLRVSQYTGVTQRKGVDGSDNPDTRAESLIGYKCVEHNDLVVNIMLAWNGSMGVSKFRGITSPAYCVYRFLDGAHPWFFHYLLRSPIYKAYIKNESTGIVDSRLRLYTDGLYRLYAFIPPLPEQTAIVRFLDHADRHIRRYIRAKQKLIVLLEEQKQAIIHQAVTGQIDVRTGQPYPSYKNSGVEWLGEVPAHWDIRRAKYLLEECDTRSVDGSEELLRVSQYTGVTLRSPTGDGDKPYTRAASLVGYKRVELNDLVVNIMLAWNGSMGVSQFRGITSPAYCVYRFRANSHPWYFHHLLRSPVYKARIKAVSTGVIESRLRLYTDDLYRLEALVPPFPEQAAIVRFLDKSTISTNSAISRTRRQSVLFQEYLTRLIADVVTGKLDVREAAAELPEVDPLAEDNLDSTIHDRENSNLGEPDAEKSAAEYTIKRR